MITYLPLEISLPLLHVAPQQTSEQYLKLSIPLLAFNKFGPCAMLTIALA